MIIYRETFLTMLRFETVPSLTDHPFHYVLECYYWSGTSLLLQRLAVAKARLKYFAKMCFNVISCDIHIINGVFCLKLTFSGEKASIADDSSACCGSTVMSGTLLQNDYPPVTINSREHQFS